MNSRCKWALSAFALFGIALAQPGKAAVVNGGFEGFPDFTGYSTIGNASIQQGDFHTPTEGLQQAVISNSTSPAPDTNPSVTNIGTLDNFFNLAPGFLESLSVASGSGFKQTFSASTGDVLSFDADFATNQSANGQDFGFLTLTDPNGATNFFNLSSLMGPQGPTNPLDGISAYFDSETGYTHFSVGPLGSSGAYTLAFGIANDPDTLDASGLLVDNIGGATGANVPLPSTAWTGFALLGGLLGASRVIRRRRPVLA
jgi:hypothetical protein